MDPPGLGEGGFEAYFRAVRKHPVVVAATVVVVVLAAWAWLLLQPVTYSATADVLVTTVPFGDSTYQGLSVVLETPANPVQSYETAAAILDSPSASRLTAAQLGAGWSSGRVSSHVTVQPAGASDIVSVQATASSPQAATNLADTFTTVSLGVIEQRLSQQAGHVLAVLRASPRELTEQPQLAQRIGALVAVRRGIDPVFGLLHSAQGTATRTSDSSLRLLGLALVPAAVLGVAVALLWESIASRRRRERDGVVSEYAGA
jgi:capsular polysaccharide biosynthesis protein